MKIKLNSRWLLVLVISFIASILNILHVLIGFAKTPPGMIYLWTGHYYLDYFEYVQAMAQGIRGNWLIVNYFTTENSSGYIFGITQYLFLGKIGKLFFLNPFATYWFLVFLFSIILGVLVFVAIRKLLSGEPFYKSVIAYSLFLFAGPLFAISKNKGLWEIIIYGFWNDKSVLWKRFGSVPHHLLANIFSLTIILLTSKLVSNREKNRSFIYTVNIIVITLLFYFLLLYSPANALLIFATIFFTLLVLGLRALITKKKQEALRIILLNLILTALIVPPGLVIQKIIVNDVYRAVSNFESVWQIHPPLKDVLLAFGLILPFSLLGLKSAFKQLYPLRLFFYGLILASGVLFFSPIASWLGTTNTRFLTPLVYILFSVLAVKVFSRKKNLILFTLILFLLFLPANIRYFQSMLDDKNLFSPITYLPKGIVEGYCYLNTLPDKKAVLVTPSQILGLVLPIYSNRKVYIAHHNSTPDYINKNITASNFYLGVMNQDQARSFLKANKLDYVVLTSIEGYEVKVLYNYSFLQEVYKNRDIAIFKLKIK